MLLDTPDPGSHPEPHAYNPTIQHLLATYLPLRPEGQLALLSAWLIDHQNQQRTALDQTTTSAADPAFTLLRAITDHLLGQVLAYSAELGDPASRAQALVDHHRDLEATAALGARITTAISDENTFGAEVTAWVVAARARHAAELATANAATG